MSTRKYASGLRERRYTDCARLVAETNAESARSASEIAVGTDGFQLADGVTDFDRTNLWAGECDHFSEFASGNEFHCGRAEHRAQRSIKRRRRSAALKVTEHAPPR